jgi:hypothetical protein
MGSTVGWDPLWAEATGHAAFFLAAAVVGYKKLYHACDDGHDCCSKTCLTVRNTTTPLKVCE